MKIGYNTNFYTFETYFFGSPCLFYYIMVGMCIFSKTLFLKFSKYITLSFEYLKFSLWNLKDIKLNISRGNHKKTTLKCILIMLKPTLDHEY